MMRHQDLQKDYRELSKQDGDVVALPLRMQNRHHYHQNVLELLSAAVFVVAAGVPMTMMRTRVAGAEEEGMEQQVAPFLDTLT